MSDELDTSAAVDRYLSARKPEESVRASLSLAAGVDADAEAEFRKLSQQSGIPIDSVRSNKAAVQQRVTAPNYDELASKFPSTTKYLSTLENARIAHDDVDNLTAIEQSFLDAYASGRASKGRVGEEYRRQVGNMRGEERSFLGGFSEPVRRGLAQGDRGLSILLNEMGVLNSTRDDMGVRLANQQRRVERFPTPQNIQQGMQEIGGATTFREAIDAALSNPRAILETSLQSIGASAPALIAAAAGSTIGPIGTATGAGLGSFAVEYANTIQDVLAEKGIDGKDPLAISNALGNAELMAAAREKAIKRGVPIAVFDALTAGLAGKVLAGAKGTFSSVAPRIAGELGVQAAGGAAGEATAQALTDEYKPGDILLEAIAEMPTSIVEVPGNYSSAIERSEAKALEAENLTQLADASKLRQRDPAAFQQFVADLAESGDAPAEFFIDAEQLTNSLNQSAVSLEQLRAFAPAVAKQLEASVPGADIRIPVAEFASAPSEISALLVDHIRENPEAMSRAEAQAFMAEAGPRIQQDVQTALAQEDIRSERKQAIDKVTLHFQNELDAVGKFRPEVNKAYAAVLGNFYGTQAERAGLSVEDFMERYRVKVAKVEGALGSRQRLEQNGDVANPKDVAGKTQGGRSAGDSTPGSPAFDEWFEGSKAVDDDGAPLLVFHGTNAEFSEFDLTRGGSVWDDAASRTGVFFSADRHDADHFGGVAESQNGGKKRVLGSYLRLRNPLMIDDRVISRFEGNWLEELRSSDPDEYDLQVNTKQYQNSGGIGKGLELAILDAKRSGRDGAIIDLDGESKMFVVFDATGIRITNEPSASAGSDANTVNQGPRASLSFANDITSVPSIIALMEGADLSSFLHESGHLFLEVLSDLAARIQGRIGRGEEVSDSERGIVKDMEAILGWMGLQGDAQQTPLAQWQSMTLEEKREHHEKWARGFEKYLQDGRAPTLELQDLFSKFRAWILRVYEALGGLDAKISDEVRQVMDRMLASDEAIAEAESARNMGPLFESPEQSGMTPAEYRDYQAIGERQTTTASAELDARMLKDMKWMSRARDKALKERQAEVDELRKEVEREVRAQVLSTDVYQAWQFLTGKKPKPMEKSAAEVDYDRDAADWKQKRAEAEVAAEKAERAKILEANPDAKGLQRGQLIAKNKRQIGINVQQAMLTWDQANPKPVKPTFPDEPVPPGFEAGKLRTDETKAIDKAAASILQERRMTSPEGIDPDLLADRFGFSSGDHLIKTLASAPPPQQVIEEMVDQQMLERYGDITSEAALKLAADEAIYSEVRARVVATELKALEKATSVRGGKRGTIDVMARAAKEFAEAVIAGQRVRDLRPSQYSAAAARNARLAKQALGKSTEEAAMHKRNELINGYAAKAAYEAQAEVKALQRYFRKFDKRLDSIDAGYQDQIDQMLERFDFKPASLKAIDKRKAFAEWYAEQEAAGNPPSVPDSLLENAAKQSYKDMTVEELRGLRDTIKQIEHQGRLKKKLLLARDQRDFDAIAEEMAASIIQHGGKPREVQLEPPTGRIAKAGDKLSSFVAGHRKLSSLFRQMDGHKDEGPMWAFIGQQMNERGTMEDVMLEKATIALRDLYEPLTKMRGGITGHRSKMFIPEIKASPTRGGRLAIALNWGNADNRQRLLDGNKWTEGQARAVLATLTAQELEFVNKAWAYLETYWAEIAAKEKRLTGVEPPKVEAVPFNVMSADGIETAMTGGYFPIRYDADASNRTAQQDAAQVAKEMMQGAFTKATTRRGHTKERLKEVNRKLRLDLNVITQHVTQVVHDLAWHEFLIDTNKLLGDDRISDAILAHYGPKVMATIRSDIEGIAAANIAPQKVADEVMLAVRNNISRSTMGLSLTTAFLQPFGVFNSMQRIGVRPVLHGMARWVGDAAQMENTIARVRDKSEFMRLRGKTFNRELREISGTVAGKSKTMQVVDAGLFVMMQKMQMVADIPTWVGQYEKSISEGAQEADAVAQADRAVLESQGGGHAKDLAQIQREHPFLTQFFSYFSTTYNRMAESTAATNFKNPASLAGWLADMTLLAIIPAIGPALLLHLLRGGGDDDEDSLAENIVQWQLSYLLGSVMLARELSGGVSGFDYTGPPVARLVADAVRAGKQTLQGEWDEALVKSYINLTGSAFGIPTVQAMRSYRGWKAWDEGEDGAGPQSVLLGPPPRD